jgi:hypothetical protein
MTKIAWVKKIISKLKQEFNLFSRMGEQRALFWMSLTERLVPE